MRKTSFVLIFWLLLIVPLSAQNGEPYAEKIARFEQFVKQQMARDPIPGLSIAFMKDDFVWAKGFGYADLENKTPATAESAYRLASVTKPMTAVAILQLVEESKIDLDAEVQEYVPYFPQKPWPVKVGLLLGHLGGIPHYVNYDEEGHFKYHKDTREAIAVFENFDLAAEPGTEYNYTSYGYNLLGAVIEGASGQSYGDYMREQVWGPAGMDATRLDDPDDLIPNRVRGYRMINGEIKNSEFVNISSRFAAGGTRSTAIDLIKFAQGLLSGKLLSEETMNKMWTSMATADGHFTDYGQGWGIGAVNGRFRVAHSGGQPETSTYLVLFPADRFAMAITTNLENSDRMPYLERLYELILDEPPDIEVYTGNKSDDAIYAAMENVFNYGLSQFEYVGNSAAPGPEEAAAAFDYFNQHVNRKALRTNFDETVQKIRDGRHPVADQAFVKLGLHMSAKLQDNMASRDVQKYHKAGAIPFFSDFIQLQKSNGSTDESLRFRPEFEKLVENWHRDWLATWNETTQTLRFTPDFQFDSMGQKLKKTFAGAQVTPDFIDDFTDLAEYYLMQEQMPKVLTTTRLVYDLYPNSAETNNYQAVAHVLQGDKASAEPYIKRSFEIEPDGGSIGGDLNQLAYNLAAAGMADAGLDLLLLAVKANPEEPNLYDSIGEFYLNKGDIQKSVTYYKKALKVNPDFSNAQRMLERIRKEYPEAVER